MSAAEHKTRGNELQKQGDLAGACEAYTHGLSLARQEFKETGSSEDLHVLLSNRSLVYLQQGQLNEALKDAEECIKVKPLWGRGYGRKGNALFAMRKWKLALQAYEEGSTIDRRNTALIDGLTKSREMLEQSILAGETVDDAENTKDDVDPNANNEGNKQGEGVVEEEDDDPMASFLKDISALDEGSGKAKVSEDVKDEPVTVVDHEEETKGWTSENQTERILQKNFQWINVNPFAVFGLCNENATEEDIKKRFHKLSALVHPDKNPHTRAQEAFHEVNKAYLKLKDSTSRQLLAEIIRQCKNRVAETRARLKAKGLTEQELVERDGTEEEAMEKEVKREFASREHKRQTADLNKRKYNQREMEAEREESEYWQSVKKVEEGMREGREDRAKNWQDFAKKGKRRKL